jgi:hypothetical protein
MNLLAAVVMTFFILWVGSGAVSLAVRRARGMGLDELDDLPMYFFAGPIMMAITVEDWFDEPASSRPQ